MRHRCCIKGCENNNPKVMKRRIPVLYEHIYKIWLQRISRPGLDEMDPRVVYNNYRVCDRHFSNHCRILKQSRLKFGSLPTMHLPNFNDTPSTENSIFRYPTTREVIAAPIKIFSDVVGVNSDGVPSIPPDCPTCLSKPRTSSIKCPSEKRQKLKCQEMQKVLTKNLGMTEVYFSSRSFSDLDRAYTKILDIELKGKC